MSGSGVWTVLGVPIDSVGAPAGGVACGTELSPAVLRDLGLIGRLAALDAGDLAVRITGPGREEVSGIVGWPSVGAAVTAIRSAVSQLLSEGRRPLVLGGCCTLLMGAAAAARDVLGRVGLAYVDGHVDVYDNRTSPTGEAADMPVAALLGLGWPGLLDTMGATPVVAGRDIVVTGAPSSWRALTRCSLSGSGESWGDGPASLLVEGQHDTAAPSSCGAADRQQKDAPQSASQ
jgi:arginase